MAAAAGDWALPICARNGTAGFQIAATGSHRRGCVPWRYCCAALALQGQAAGGRRGFWQGVGWGWLAGRCWLLPLWLSGGDCAAHSGRQLWGLALSGKPEQPGPLLLMGPVDLSGLCLNLRAG